MRISVFGGGVGSLVLAGSLAQSGNQVKVVGAEDLPVEGFHGANKVYDEPGLLSLLRGQLQAGRLQYVSGWNEAIVNSEVIFIGLPTSKKDLIVKLIEEIGLTVDASVLVVNQSTFAVGTADEFQLKLSFLLKNRKVNFTIDVLVMPETFSKGSAIKEFLTPDRIIVGGGLAESRLKLTALFKAFCFDENQMKYMSTRAAEYTKFALNAMLATRVSLINELANSAELFGIDMEEVRQGIGSDRRIGFNYINPGCGFGGASFTADMNVLIAAFDEKGADSTLLRSVLLANENQKEVLFRKAWRYFKGDLKAKKFAVWGVSYKPNTPFFTKAPSLKLVTALLAQDAEVVVYDPKAGQQFVSSMNTKNLSYTEEMYEALQDVDALFVLTEWRQFWNPDFDEMAKKMKGAVIFDGRNIYSPKLLEDKGFMYTAVGRGRVV